MPGTLSRCVDLHCRSSASACGGGTPAAVVQAARACGCVALSITDVDSVDAVENGREAAVECDLEYLSGVELSVAVDDPALPEKHAALLAYGIEVTAALAGHCSRLRRAAEERNEEFLARLFALDMADLSEEDLREHVKRSYGEADAWKRPLSLGPIAELLVERGCLESADCAAALALQRRVCADLDALALPALEPACELVRGAGGVVMLARPLGPVATQPGGETQRLRHWLDRYVDGLEIYLPGYGAPARQLLLDVAASLQRPWCGGSDASPRDRAGRPVVCDAPAASVESIRQFRDSGRCRAFPQGG